MNRRSRTFVRDLRLCTKEVRVMEQVFQGGTLQEDADALTTVKGDCGKLRDTMLGMDTTHFSSQALDAYVAMDRYKSALGKVGDYIDTSAPTKLSEAKQGLAEATQLAQQAVAEINSRRATYGLPAL
jgi:hypothetical protein